MHTAVRPSSSHSKVSVILLLLSMVLLGVFPLDILLPSFPALSAHFNTSSANIALSISIFAIGFSISQFFLGPLSDRLGRKRLLIIGMLVSIAGAGGCLGSTQFSTFILFRSIQAIGCGCFVLSNALVQDIFSNDERERVRILMTTASGVFISTAPLLGTLMQNLFDWTGSFYLFVVIAGLVLVHARWALPAAIIAPSNSGFWRCCVRIVSNHRFMGFSLLAAIAFTCHFAFIAISPVIFLENMGLTQLEFSFVLLIYGAAYVAGGIVASRLQKLVSHQQQFRTGLALIALAGLVLTGLHLVTDPGLLTVLLPMMICTLGTSIVRPVAASRAMDVLPDNAGAAASMLNTTVFVTGGVMSAVASMTVGHFETVLGGAFLVLSATGWVLVRQLYRS